MTRTLGAAVGFLLIVLFFAGVAIEKTRRVAASDPRRRPVTEPRYRASR